MGAIDQRESKLSLGILNKCHFGLINIIMKKQQIFELIKNKELAIPKITDRQDKVLPEG